MATKVKSKPAAGRQISMLFAEEQQMIATPAIIGKCMGARVSIDVETTGLEWWRDRLIGLGLYCPERQVRHYIPLFSESEIAQTKAEIRALAQNEATHLVGHNLKFDAHFLELPLWQVPCKQSDTTIAAHIYDSRLQKNLGALEQTFLHTSTKQALKGKSGGAKVKEMPLGQVADYCINDARITMEVLNVLMPLLAELRLERLFWKDMHYVGDLQRIERRGMLLDLEFIHNSVRVLKQNLASLETLFYDKVRSLASAKGLPDPMELTLLNERVAAFKKRVALKNNKALKKQARILQFNWRSDEQLSVVIYEGIGHPMPKNPFADADGVDRSKFATRGNYNDTATNAFLLMEKGDHPLGHLLMEMREADKLRDTLENWLSLADDAGVIHGSFNPTGTRTGRLSSSEPNLQNVASDTRSRSITSVFSGGANRVQDYNLRLGLRARPGYVFLSLDHKQQEMRMFAIESQEQVMLEAVRLKLDIHTEIAKSVWAADIAREPALLKVRREWSKTIGFGLLYGMTTGSLQHRLNKTNEEAKAITEAYWTKFPRIMPFLQETINKCKRFHYLRYWSGRLWREDSEEDMYKGCNALVQGGSADVISIAVKRMWAMLDARGKDEAVVSIIHDEVLLEVRDTPEDIAECERLGLRVMEVEDIFKVPFAADSKAGYSYGAMDDVKLLLAPAQGA